MKHQVCIIAEAGVNHNGKVDLAMKLIDEAASAGVDYVKFQTWVTDDIIDQSAPKATYQKENDGADSSQYEMLKKLELSFDSFRILKEYCDTKGVKFLSTPDDEKSLNFLVDELKMDVIKVGSGEITNIPFLRKIGQKGLEVILSTGMSGLGEVERAYNTLLHAGAKHVTILHCTSNYPAPYDSINLQAMKTLEYAFKTDIGYSDHTEGIAISLAAVAMGAKVIEKHYTLDRNMPGPDHKASMDPIELKQLVIGVRQVEMAISGNGKKEIQDTERDTKAVVTKGIYLKNEVPEGTILAEDMFLYKRPQQGLAADQADIIVGRKLNKSLKQGSPVNWKDISFE
ncbi:N-acetylneuraminate synthase/N,N'-diacetyllegionaminate synthase [Chitinophaga dinghuensis]|uniref:N-acetylneuraminate synthase/N,N'-diacetyllegionaminate synthase n=1 Tax=Chitinophaga dinghuensis TaxID=1539050 RepID=A0A327W987_9BACT|nr:N-acetylneuraminate synthase [Chitinophaga dinghuensis]RAJ85802.1 N-acetylneuraminate synthase/N,N'-diacetyllegionaminate synthase [Chitinophaga dinghuensis]